MRSERLMLIEDLRSGGALITWPKSSFATSHHSIKINLEHIEMPDAMVESYGNIAQDFRANFLIDLDVL